MADPITAATIRCRNDLKLYETLLADPLVKRVNERIARHEQDNPMNLRRRLLATSVHLSERMAPDLHDMAVDCMDRLDLDIRPELYAYAGPQFNAMCMKPEEGRLFIMFSSALLEAFEADELKFVLGHELGHHAYQHHDIPIGIILRGGERPEPRLALSLFTWSRYAEISCDRAGAHCAGNMEVVGRALFKLASGLSGRTIDFNLQDFLAQVEQMQVIDQAPGEGAPQEDWFSTHPFSPLRVKAVALFQDSQFVRPDGMSAEALEEAVQQVRGLMDPSYLEGRSKAAVAMRRLLFAGTVLIGNADGEMSPEEIELFERFFGAGAYKDGFDLEALEASLAERIANVRDQASPSQAMQVLRDLCLVSRAEGHTTDSERALMLRVADGLGLAGAIVDRTLCADYDPD